MPATVSRRTVSTPATTWALVTTRSGATTKPVPCSRRRHCGASPSTRTTDGRTSSTTACSTTAGSAGVSSWVGRGSKGAMAAGTPESSMRRTIDDGSPAHESGATSSTVASTEDPRMASPNCPGRTVASGNATIQVTRSVATACTTAPKPESRPTAIGERMRLRSDCPATAPTVWPTTMRPMRVATPMITRAARPSTRSMAVGASSRPTMPPATTPMMASPDASAPCRHPSAMAPSTTNRSSRSSVSPPSIAAIIVSSRPFRMFPDSPTSRGCRAGRAPCHHPMARTSRRRRACGRGRRR